MGPWAQPQQMPASPAPFSPRARPLLAALATVSASLALALLGPAPSGAAAKPVELDPALKTLLASGNLRDFDGACAKAVEQGDGPRLRLLQQRLLGLHPAPQPLAVVFANAEVLLRCEAPDGALQVLARISPAAGAERIQWLVMQWRAAQAGLNHQVAANALRRLAAGNLAQLEALELPVSRRQDGTAVTRSALDLLAGHLESLGQRQRAAEVLLSGTQPGAVNAARLAQAVALFDGLPAVEQDRLPGHPGADRADRAGGGAAAAAQPWHRRCLRRMAAGSYYPVPSGRVGAAIALAALPWRPCPPIVLRSPAMTAYCLGSLLYEGKAKRVYATDRPDLVAIEFKDDATAFNALKKAELAGKGELNCQISARLFEYLAARGVPTHYLGVGDTRWMLVRPVRVIPVEVVIRNVAAGSLCKQMPIELGTCLEPALLDLYYKDDDYGDPLLTEARLELLGLVNSDQRRRLEELARQVNRELMALFSSIGLQLVDFKIELGFTASGDLVVADEISPDTCRLWDRAVADVSDRILDKDRFRQDLGGVVEAYGEVCKRVQGACPQPRVYG